MGIYSIWHWLIVLSIAVLLFGGKRVSKTIKEIAITLKDVTRSSSHNNSNNIEENR